MHRTRTAALIAAASLFGLVAAGCGGDDGAGVRELESGGGSGAGSGSAAGSGAHGGSGSAAHGTAKVPEGVAAQYATLEREIAAEGGETTSGPWRIAYIVEAAEPWFEPAGADYRFRQPAPGETHHIEIIPFEASTGRVVPTVPIRLEIVDAGGQVVDAKDLNFYYAEFFHYANNFSVPQAGQYTLRATLQEPQLMRHGEQAQGPVLPEGARVEFAGVQLDPPA